VFSEDQDNALAAALGTSHFFRGRQVMKPFVQRSKNPLLKANQKKEQMKMNLIGNSFVH
jgi:hypothetical protein